MNEFYKLMKKQFLTNEEFKKLSLFTDVVIIDNGVSGLHFHKHWFKVIHYAKEYSVYID